MVNSKSEETQRLVVYIYIKASNNLLKDSARLYPWFRLNGFEVIISQKLKE